MNVTLFGKVVFTDGSKDLEMRLSWIIQTGPKPSAECSQKKQQEGRDVKEGHVKTKAEIGELWPQAKETWGLQKLQEAGRTVPLGPSDAVWLCQHLTFRLLPRTL